VDLVKALVPARLNEKPRSPTTFLTQTANDVVERRNRLNKRETGPRTACDERLNSSRHAKEGTIGRAGKTTIAKRDREKAKQIQRREKDARREQRKTEKPARPLTTEGEDPDLAGLQWGPQEPLY
jgi:hypothetical protein